MHYSLINSVHVSRQIYNNLSTDVTDVLYVAIALFSVQNNVVQQQNSFCMWQYMANIF